PSQAFEVFEGFETAQAAVQSLAGRGSELAHPLGPGGIAPGAAHLRIAPQLAWRRDASFRRSDAVLAQLLASAFRQPIAGPRRRKNGLDSHRCVARFTQLCLDLRPN